MLIEFPFKCGKIHGRRLEFEIRDTGIGISPDTLKHLMQPFVQGDSSTTRKYGGTGLGLVISKQIIKFMNGDIKVQSELGKGTTVSWWVTLRRVDSKDNHSITEVLKFKRNLDILVVEDNSVNRKLFSTLITSLNISCDCAENGFDALTACQKKKYDMIFMDLMMPVMGGIEASTKIRQECTLNFVTPIIALTASVDLQTRHEAEKAGMVDFLSKPAPLLRIGQIIGKYIKS